MKICSGIIIIMGLIVSKITSAQDTTHERLVDKYYPKSEQPMPIPKTAKVNPVVTPTTQPALVNTPVKAIPLTAEVNEKNPPLNELNKEVVPVTQTASQIQDSPSLINGNPGKINKISGKTKRAAENSNSAPASPIYRDTRLGSSSPLYNTYKKNDNGAGAITTNPNKG